jgi:hypothetical protein
MNEKFINRCNNERDRNERLEWNPNIKELTKEIAWRAALLHHVLLDGNLEQMQKYAANLARLCEKVYTQAEEAKMTRSASVDHYGDFVGWLYPLGVAFRPQGK